MISLFGTSHFVPRNRNGSDEDVKKRTRRKDAKCTAKISVNFNNDRFFAKLVSSCLNNYHGYQAYENPRLNLQ